MGRILSSIKRTLSMPVPESVQRHIASFGLEGAARVRRGDVLFGSARGDIAAEQRRCVCGICLGSGSPATASCTLLSDGRPRVVRRKTTELCLPICISRYPLRMILKLVRSILRDVATRIPAEDRVLVRVTLQVEDRSDSRPRNQRPYLVNACLSFTDGAGALEALEVDFFKHLDPERHDISVEYAVGDRIPDGAVPAAVPARLERALIEGSGRTFSLVVVAPGLPEEDFRIGSVRFRFEAVGFRASPLYLFVQARQHLHNG